jgi:hypothetical protein
MRHEDGGRIVIQAKAQWGEVAIGNAAATVK